MSAAAGSGQLPLALRAPPDQRLDAYVDPPEGALAQLRATARAPGADWLYLTGAAGSGKTHLALAACAEAESAGRRAAYLPLRTFAGRLPAVLEGLDGYDVLAIDDLDAVSGSREDEVALFDLHNRAHAAGAATLYTATAAPDALGLALPDLRSRLNRCARIALAPLDDAGRAQVLRQRAQRRGLSLDDASVDWLLRRVDRDLSSLTALLDTLDSASLAAQRRVTVPFLRQVLGAH